MTAKTLKGLGYEHCRRIGTWRLKQGVSYASNVIEIDMAGCVIVTAYGFDEWACDEVIRLMEATKEANK